MISYGYSDDHIMITFPGSESYTILSDNKNYRKVRDILEKYKGKPITDEKVIKELRALMSIKETIRQWTHGEIVISHGVAVYRGMPLPADLNSRLVSMAEAGDEGWVGLANFWRRLSENPSWRSTQQVYGFLKHQHLPIDMDGYLYAYKGVNLDYTDRHTGLFSNKPGTAHSKPRGHISDDPTKHCHVGFHVGDYTYAKNFASKLVIVRVDPKNVVCVPDDENRRKVRVCEYEVVADAKSGSPLPDNIWEPKEGQYSGPIVRAKHVFSQYDVYVTMVTGMEHAKIRSRMRIAGVDPETVDRAFKATPKKPVKILSGVSSHAASILKAGDSKVRLPGVSFKVVPQVPTTMKETEPGVMVSSYDKKLSDALKRSARAAEELKKQLTKPTVAPSKVVKAAVVRTTPVSASEEHTPPDMPTAAPDIPAVMDPAPTPKKATKPAKPKKPRKAPAPKKTARKKPTPKKRASKPRVPPSTVKQPSRQEMREKVRKYGIKAASKLSVNHLRKLMAEIEAGRIDDYKFDLPVYDALKELRKKLDS